jgi:predicted N-acetyltransferase YhbS
MDTLVVPQADLNEELGAQVADLNATAWPKVQGPRDWHHDPLLEPVFVLLVEDGTVVASLAVLSKQIQHGGARFAASGLSAVVTDPARRREGLGHRITLTARELMRERGADLGIFTCDRELVAFYGTAGWEELSGTALVGGIPEDPLVSSELSKVTMGAFFTPHAQQHAAAFHGAQVLLYPGTRDRLW